MFCSLLDVNSELALFLLALRLYEGFERTLAKLAWYSETID